MDTTDFTFTLLSNRTPDQVFNAICDVRSWWTGYYAERFTGNSEKLNDEFTFVAGDDVHRSTQKLIEVIPGKKMVWLIADSNLSFLENADEWTGTKVVFDIYRHGNKTKLVFTHEGLKPDSECYGSCAPAWTQYLEHKLQPLINS